MPHVCLTYDTALAPSVRDADCCARSVKHAVDDHSGAEVNQDVERENGEDEHVKRLRDISEICARYTHGDGEVEHIKRVRCEHTYDGDTHRTAS